MNKPAITHIGLYHQATRLLPFRTYEEEGWYDARGQASKGLKQATTMHRYETHLGHEDFGAEKDGMRLVKVIAIPASLLETLQERFETPVKLGEGVYTVRKDEGKKIALHLQNQPKGWESKVGKATKGFGSFLNLAILLHLKESGVTHLRESFYRTEASHKQHEGHADRVEWRIEDLEEQLRKNVREKLGSQALALLEKS